MWCLGDVAPPFFLDFSWTKRFTSNKDHISCFDANKSSSTGNNPRRTNKEPTKKQLKSLTQNQKRNKKQTGTQQKKTSENPSINESIPWGRDPLFKIIRLTKKGTQGFFPRWVASKLLMLNFCSCKVLYIDWPGTTAPPMKTVPFWKLESCPGTKVTWLTF